MPLVDDARDMHFDETQANTFLAWVRDEWPQLDWHFTTLIDTGVRLNELCGLRTTSFDNDIVRVRKRISQTGKTVSRDVPLTDDMKRVATEMKSKHPQLNQCFAHWMGRHCEQTMPANCWVVCCVMVVPPWACHPGEESMRPHDLRHTFAYLTAKAGADLGDLQYLMGHEDISQTMRYRGFIKAEQGLTSQTCVVCR